MRSGQRRLELLIDLAPTARRLALLGGYWKLRARLARLAGQAVEPALLAMTAAYRTALDEAAMRTGAADYETVFNALAGALLLKACGQDQAWRDMRPGVARLLQDAVGNAHQRYTEERKALDICVEVQSALLGALWASYEGPPYALVFGPLERQKVAALYIDALRRFGSIGEPEALAVQVQFILEMLPPHAPEGSIEARLHASLRAFVAQLPLPS